MGAFFEKTFRDYKWSIITYSSIVFLYGAMLISFYPSLKNLAQDFEKMLESFPAGFREAFGINEKSFSSIEGFLSVEYFSLTWILIVSLLLFSLGASAVAGEIDKGTSEFSFTLPLRRSKVVFGKFLAGCVILLGIVFLTMITTIVGSLLIGESITLAGFLDFTLVASALGFFLLSFATFFSTILSSKGGVYTVCGGFFIGSYLIHILEGISHQLGGLYTLSFFKYYGTPQAILAGEGIAGENLLVFLIGGVVLLGLGLVMAERRDL